MEVSDFYLEQLEKRRIKRLSRKLGHFPGLRSLASNDYLGMREQSLKFQDHQERPGGFGASRVLAESQQGLLEIERSLASFKKAESCLLFPTGYQASVGILQALAVHKKMFFLVDQSMHMSFLDGRRASGISKENWIFYQHACLNDLEKKLSQLRGQSTCIVTESLFSMSGKSPDPQKLTQIARAHSSLLLVDEAHSIGCLGGSGAGLYLHDENEFLICTHPCGKAVGLQGAFVTSPRWFTDLMINFSRAFVYSTGISPRMAADVHRSVEYLKTADLQRQKLREITKCFEGYLKEGALFSGNHHIKFLNFNSLDLAQSAHERLKDEGFYAPVIRFPTIARGHFGLRISLNSSLKKRDIQTIAEGINHAS